jgi:hypothetical protein
MKRTERRSGKRRRQSALILVIAVETCLTRGPSGPLTSLAAFADAKRRAEVDG